MEVGLGGAGFERAGKKDDRRIRGTMRMKRGLAGVFLCCSISFAFAGCSGKPDSREALSAGAGSARADTVVVEGLLTGEVIECAAVRSAAGVVFALEDLPPPFDEWRRFVDERFMVIGEEVDPGRCGQSRTLRVLDMGLVLPPVIQADRDFPNG
jgi:hypothetical protein